LYFEKAFTITINDVSEGTTSRFRVDTYNTSGNYTSTHYVHGTQVCSSGSLAATCLSFGSLTNKWVRLGVGCSGSVMVGKIIGSHTNGTPTAYVHDDKYYNSRTDAENSQNATIC